jgi:hypothetical protein
MTLAEAATFLASVLTSVAILAGGVWAVGRWFADLIANRWLKDVEAKHAKELAHVESELQRLNQHVQAQLDHAVTVSRAQFETEFEALKEIWERVARVRNTLGEINPFTVPEEETPPQRLQRFYAARLVFVEAHNELLRAIDSRSPFYPEGIYAVLDQLRLRTGLEASRLNTRRPPFAPDADESDNFNWYEQRDTARAEIEAGADAVSTAIRQRLGSISIRE